MSAVTPAFPDMRAALGVSAGSAGWLITAYSLPGIALTPLVGILADRRGRKGTLFGSLVLYGLAGGGCALAPGFGLLLALRFLQGIGGAALFSLSVTIISDLYQGPWRARALALDAGAVGLGAAVFPAIGGSLALLGWRLPFATAFLAVPLALALLWRLDVPEPRPSGSLRGYLLDVRRHLANRAVRGNLLITVLINFVLVGAFFGYLPHVLEAGFGASALVIGVIMAMRALSFFGTSTLLDRLGWLAGPRVRVEWAAGLAAFSMALIPLVPGVWWVLVPAGLYGVSYGVTLPSLEALLAEQTPGLEHAAFLSLKTGIGRIGSTAGPLVLGLLYDWLGGAAVFWVAALVSLGIVLLAARTLA